MICMTGMSGKRGMKAALGTLLMGAASAAMAQLPATTVLPIAVSSAIVGQAPGGSTTACTTTLPTAAGVVVPGDGCPGTQATLNGPYGATVDSFGNVYFGDYNTFSLRVLYMGGTSVAAAIQAANPTATITPQVGYVYTLAGSRTAALATSTTVGGTTKLYYCNGAGSGVTAIGSNGDGCPGTYGYTKPRNPVIDPEGNVIFTSGVTSTPVRVLYLGGPKMAALISILNQGLVAQVGYMYSIIKVASTGYGGDGAIGTDSTVRTLTARDVAVDSAGNIYMSDGTNTYTLPSYGSNNNIRRVDINTGIITTYAGSGGCATGQANGCVASLSGDGGPATSATFNSPYTIFFDQYDNLYITDYNNDRIRVVYKGGTVPGLSNLTVGNVYTVVGGGSTAATAANSNVPATSLSFGLVYTGGIDPAGNIYFADSTSKLLWRVDGKTGTANYVGGGRSSSTTAAQACSTGSVALTTDKLGDGCPTTQNVFVPSGKIPFDRNGNYYELENGNALIRKLSFNTIFPATAVGSTATQSLAFLTVGAQTFAAENFTLQGTTTAEYSNAGSNTCAIGTATTAGATCVFNVKFTPTVAGLRPGSMSLANATATLITEGVGGAGIAANISVDPPSTTTVGTGLTPNGVGTDLNGNLYVSDAPTGRVLKVAATGGTPTAFMTGLSTPGQIAVDGAGNVYVADQGNNRIAVTSAAGGTPTSLGTGLSKPQGVVVDQMGTIYVADTGNNRIVAIAPQGTSQSVVMASGLSGPTKLALDSAGNLYVADLGNNRVVELPLLADQQTINLGTSTVTPGGLAVDAAGDVYVADSVSGEVLLYPPGVTNPTAVLIGLSGPKGLAVDTNGSVYVADASATGVLVANRHTPATVFPNTNLNTSNTSQINVVNTGNAALSFTGSSFAAATGATASAFKLTASPTNGCVLTTALSIGGQCALTATFTPTAIASYSATETFTTNAANSGQALLSGAGVFLVTTSTALAVTSPTTSTINYAQAVTVTATVTAAANAGAVPSGTITFSVDGKKQTPVAVPASGIVTLTLNPAVGTHAVSVSYSGDTLYASSSNSTSFTVLKATTVTTLSITPGGTSTPTLTFTATVSSPTATGQTGTVTFYAGTVQIGSPATVSGGKASLTTSTVTYNSYSFTAVYSGDSNFNGSTSTASAATGQLFNLPGTTAVTVPQGGVATITTTLTPLFNYAGTVTAACSGLPANSVCRFVPITATFAAPAAGTAALSQVYTVYVYTNVKSDIAALGLVGKGLLASLPMMLLAMFAGRRKTFRGVVALGVVLVLGLSGCAGGTSYAVSPDKTPLGTSTVTVTLTDNSGVKQSFNVALTVIAPYDLK